MLHKKREIYKINYNLHHGHRILAISVYNFLNAHMS